MKSALAGAFIASIPAALIYNPEKGVRQNLQFIAGIATIGAITGAAMSLE